MVSISHRRGMATTSRIPRRGVVVDPPTRARLRALIERLGWRRSYIVTGSTQHTLEHVLAGSPVLATTAIALRAVLALHCPEERLS